MESPKAHLFEDIDLAQQLVNVQPIIPAPERRSAKNHAGVGENLGEGFLYFPYVNIQVIHSFLINSIPSNMV
jgi:hypothetical protein